MAWKETDSRKRNYRSTCPALINQWLGSHTYPKENTIQKPKHKQKGMDKTAKKKKRASELLLHNKKDLRTLVGLYTGHCPLKYYLHKLGQTDNATCRLCKLCKGADETAEHILCTCDAISLNYYT